MDKQKKTLGRSRVYTGNPDGSEPGEVPEEGRRSRRAQPIGTVPKEHLSEPSGRRRRDEETDAKMRLLWGILLVLVLILVAAIFYEIVLGYGSVETGSERMGTNVQETELSSGTDEEETEQERQTEEDSEEEALAVTGQDSADVQDSRSEQETPENQDSQSEQETSEGQESAVSQENQVTDTGEGTSLSVDGTLAGLAE